MLRYFISAYPKFGRGKKVNVETVISSPYFWWWYALTENIHYTDKMFLNEPGEVNEKMRAVFADFGDVSYECCRYTAFKKWWNEQVSDNETRCQYLFAEPKVYWQVCTVGDPQLASRLLGQKDQLLVSIPVYMQRTDIEKALDKILKANLKGEKGRARRDPTQSEARYHLSRTVQIKALQDIFNVYAESKTIKESGGTPNNLQIARRVGLTYKEKEKSDEVSKNSAEVNRAISNKVSRHLQLARAMIKHAGIGTFP